MLVLQCLSMLVLVSKLEQGRGSPSSAVEVGSRVTVRSASARLRIASPRFQYTAASFYGTTLEISVVAPSLLRPASVRMRLTPVLNVRRGSDIYLENRTAGYAQAKPEPRLSDCPTVSAIGDLSFR